MANHLIEGTGSLLDGQGSLREPGYALRPPFDYSHDAVAAPHWRIKDWDYYLISDDEYGVALTFSDLGYIGLISASVLDFSAAGYKTTSEMVLFPMGKMGLPASSERGDIVWSNRRCSVTFAHQNGGRRLSFAMKNFEKGVDFEAELFLDKEPEDSMVIATPWAEDPEAFYYNRKIIGMRARGGFRLGQLFHEFDGDEALGLLDWGRGVWTYDNTWYWSAAMGYQEGRVIGFNLGYGFGDTSAASENILFVDGVGHKLGRVDFGIPRTEDGSPEYLKPWHILDDEGRLDLTFTPSFDRVDYIDVAHLVTSDQHQVFGTFTGSAVLDDGKILAIDGIKGFAEHVHNKY